MGLTRKVKYFALLERAGCICDMPLGTTRKEADFHAKRLGFVRCPICGAYVETLMPCVSCQERGKMVEFATVNGIPINCIDLRKL